MKTIVFGAMGVGLLLLLLSGVWTTLFPGTSSWTPEKSAQWTKIKDRLHTLGFIVGTPSSQVNLHSGPETGQAKLEYDRLKIEHNAFAAEFQSAHDTPQTVASILKWSGISLACIGMAGWYAVNQSR